MDCAHDSFRAIRSSYDRRQGVLVYFWTCEHCGQRLDEATREDYRPAYDPHGNDRFLGLHRLERADPATVDFPDAPGVRQQVDVPEHL